MARLTRLAVPGMPHHVALRGNNQQNIFLDSQDYQSFLQILAGLLLQYKVALHSYVLLPSAFYLLLTPSDDLGMGKLLQGIGRSYVRYFNQLYHRTGTLWEGRFRSNVLQPTPYVLSVMVFQDLLPVRLGLVVNPRDYTWSSHRHYIGQETQRMLTAHPLFWKLADSPFGREAAYKAVVEAGIGLSMAEQIQYCVKGGWALGADNFVQELAEHTNRRLRPGKPGRPRKKIKEDDSQTG